MQRNIAGIDLSLTSTGIATTNGVARIRSKYWGCERLVDIREQIVTLLPVGCSFVVIEGFAFGRSYRAHDLGGLGWIIRVALHEQHIPFVIVPPLQLKVYATGHAVASKTEMVEAANHWLAYPGSQNDEADALWLRALGHDLAGNPLIELPPEHRRILNKIDLPEGVNP